MRARRTLRTFIIGLLASIFGVAGFNAFVDPYGIVHRLELTNKGAMRLCGYNDRRTIKALQMLNGPWDGIIIGNSREEAGMDPDRPAYADRTYYNAAVPGSSWEEYEALIGYALENTGVRHLILSLDLIPFSRPIVDGGGDFVSSPLRGHHPVLSLASYLFNIRTTWMSYQWLRATAANDGRVCKTNGSRYRGTLQHSHNYEKAFRNTATRQYTVAKGRFSKYETSVAKRLPALERSLRQVLKRHVRVDLFIPPLHAIAAEQYHRTSRDGDLRRFRREVLAIVERLRAEPGNENRIEMWDFMAYNAMITESVPGIVPTTMPPMRWYWDVIHVTPEFGDLIFCRMQPVRPAYCPPSPIADFGTRLTSDMIDAYEARLERERQVYLNANPDVSKFLDDLQAAVATASGQEPVPEVASP